MPREASACPICGRVFKYRACLKKHVKVHESGNDYSDKEVGLESYDGDSTRTSYTCVGVHPVVTIGNALHPKKSGQVASTSINVLNISGPLSVSNSSIVASQSVNVGPSQVEKTRQSHDSTTASTICVKYSTFLEIHAKGFGLIFYFLSKCG